MGVLSKSKALESTSCRLGTNVNQLRRVRRGKIRWSGQSQSVWGVRALGCWRSQSKVILLPKERKTEQTQSRGRIESGCWAKSFELTWVGRQAARRQCLESYGYVVCEGVSLNRHWASHNELDKLNCSSPLNFPPKGHELGWHWGCTWQMSGPRCRLKDWLGDLEPGSLVREGQRQLSLFVLLIEAIYYWRHRDAHFLSTAWRENF